MGLSTFISLTKYKKVQLFLFFILSLFLFLISLVGARHCAFAALGEHEVLYCFCIFKGQVKYGSINSQSSMKDNDPWILQFTCFIKRWKSLIYTMFLSINNLKWHIAITIMAQHDCTFNSFFFPMKWSFPLKKGR